MKIDLHSLLCVGLLIFVMSACTKPSTSNDAAQLHVTPGHSVHQRLRNCRLKVSQCISENCKPDDAKLAYINACKKSCPRDSTQAPSVCEIACSQRSYQTIVCEKTCRKNSSCYTSSPKH